MHFSDALVAKRVDRLSDATLKRLPKVDGSNKERKVIVLYQISSNYSNSGHLILL